MNERIRQLAEQVVGPSRLHGGDFALMGNNQIEKFAELIIQECCDLIMKNQYNMVPGFMERMSAYSEVCMLKEYFGVDND